MKCLQVSYFVIASGLQLTLPNLLCLSSDKSTTCTMFLLFEVRSQILILGSWIMPMLTSHKCAPGFTLTYSFAQEQI